MTDSRTIEEWAETADETPGDLVDEVPAIAAETDRADVTDRNKAVTALSRIASAHPEAVADVRPALVERLSDEGDAVRFNAALALERIATDRPDRLLGALYPVAGGLGDEDSDVQAQCGDVLAAVAAEYPEEVTDAVETILGDLVADFGTDDVSDRTSATIGFLNAASAAHGAVVPHVDALVDLFADESLGPRYHAVMAVKRVATRDPTAVIDVLDPIAARLDDSDEDVRGLAMQALAAVAESDPDAVLPALDAIGTALRDDNGEVRHHAARAMAALAEADVATVEPHADALVAALPRGPAEATDHAADALTALTEADPEPVRSALTDAGVTVEEGVESAIEAVRDGDAVVPADAGGAGGAAHEDDADGESLVDAFNEFIEGDAPTETGAEGPDYEGSPMVELDTAGDGCAYTRTVDGSTWECPHEPGADSDFCPFHAPVDETDDEAVADALLAAIESDGRRTKELIGARFGDLDLSYEILAAGDNNPIDLRHGHVAGDLTCRYLSVRQPLAAEGLVVAGDADFENATFELRADFDHAHFSTATFATADFQREARFDGAQFTGGVSFDRVQFGATTSFQDASFGDTATFRQVTATEILDLDDATFQSDLDMLELDGDVLRLVDATVHGDCNFKSARITRMVRINGLVAEGDVAFAVASVGGISGEGVEIGGDVNMVSLSADNQVWLAESTVRGAYQLVEADLSRLHVEACTIGGNVNLKNTRVHGGARIAESDIGAALKMYGVRCEAKFHLLETTIDGDLEGYTARLLGSAIFKQVTVAGETDLKRAIFERRVSFLSSEFQGPALFSDAVFRSEAKFSTVTFRGETTFAAAAFTEVLSLSEVTFAGDTDFEAATVTEVQFTDVSVEGERTIDCSRATLDGGVISLLDERLVYDFDSATLGSVELTADADVTVLEHFRFHNTTFDGFDFGQHREELSAAGWRIHTTLDGFVFLSDEVDEALEMLAAAERDDIDVDEVASILGIEREAVLAILSGEDFDRSQLDSGPTPAALENTYQKAKEGANGQGLNDIAAEFFLHEKRFRRQQHARRVRTGESVLVRARGAFDWASNLLMDATTGYGERPRNVVVSSLVTVGLFAGIYRVVDALPGGAGTAEYLLFSLQNFVTFIIGTRPQGTLVVRYTSAVEAFLGAFFVALFVFTLTRSLNR